jgi:hypothetical protein
VSTLVVLLVVLLVVPTVAMPRGGVVRPSGGTLVDDNGPLLVLGGSLFRAAWAYRHDRAWLDDQLAFLSRHRFNAIRAFGVVGDPSGADYWDGREIQWRWPDYDDVIAGLTDLAYDKYGIRVQWTIFAAAGVSVPDRADRDRLVDRFIRMSRGREHKILAFEVANEYPHNGFGGPDGLAELARLAARLNEATPIMVAASAHDVGLCEVYASKSVDLATFHFDRSREEGSWAPFVEPWRMSTEGRQRDLTGCGALPAVASNNEPIGPGTSVASETDPVRLVVGAANSYLSGLPIFTFHSGPGVRDDPYHPGGLRPSRLQELPQAEAIFGGLSALMVNLPADVPAWRRQALGEPDHPFALESGRLAGAFAAVKEPRFIVAVAGIEGRVSLSARHPMRVEVLHPLTGAVVRHLDLSGGERLELDGLEAFVLRGTRLAQR